MKANGNDIAIKKRGKGVPDYPWYREPIGFDIKEVLRDELPSVPLALSILDTASTLCDKSKNELFK